MAALPTESRTCGRRWVGRWRLAGLSTEALGRRIGMLVVLTWLFIHIAKLLAHVAGGSEKRNKKSADKPVQQVAQYEKDENIHGLQI